MAHCSVTEVCTNTLMALPVISEVKRKDAEMSQSQLVGSFIFCSTSALEMKYPMHMVQLNNTSKV